MWPRIVISIDGERPSCWAAGRSVHGVREVVLVDLPVFGEQAGSAGVAQSSGGAARRVAPLMDCAGSHGSHRRAAGLTTHSGEVGDAARSARHGRSVCGGGSCLRAQSSDWHTVMDTVVLFGRPLIDDPGRFGTVNTLGCGRDLVRP